jgi:hypothetical protein
VRVFRNLTRKCYSIQAKVGASWRTVAHADAVLVEPAELKVSEAGRQRGLRLGRKQVHAWVHGRLVQWAGAFADAATDAMSPDAYHPLVSAWVPAVADVEALAQAAWLAAGRPEVCSLSYRPHVCGRFTARFGGIVAEVRAVTQADRVMLAPHGMVAQSPR